MNGGRTLTEILDQLARQGYEDELRVDDDGRVTCPACGTLVEPADLILHSESRVEGESNPADNSIVLAVQCADCGARGALVVRYGPEASAGEAMLLTHLPDPQVGEDPQA